MKFNKIGKIEAEEFINRYTMVVGDINSGKTTLTRQILESFCRMPDAGKITVVDLAPEIAPQDFGTRNKATAIGGRLWIPEPNCVNYYHARIHPPRLRAGNQGEAEVLAAENVGTIDTLFAKALRNKTDAVFINDCSLYLHAGSAAKLLDVIRSYSTSVVNGYFGRFFSDSPITNNERSGMRFLIRHCDRLINLSPD